MCEILVRVTVDPLIGEERGDVVCIQDDGWPWTPLERGEDIGHPRGKHDFWRIIKLPGVWTEDVEAQLGTEIEEGTGRVRRAYKINLAALPKTVRDNFADDTRKEAFVESDIVSLPVMRKKALEPDLFVTDRSLKPAIEEIALGDNL